MLIEEARWLNRQFASLDQNDIFPLCNIGSSTEHFRCVEQPYIDKYLFAPARARNQEVIHVDLKAASGVDLVGDLADGHFLERIAALRVRSVMCCNLLEHVTDRKLICSAILSLLRPGGFIIATVPYRFPYHPDPIDTKFRPNINQLVKLFPGTSIHTASIVRASSVKFEMGGNYKAFCRLIASSLLPVYHPKTWLTRVGSVKRGFAGFKVTCAILRKEE
jgi:hypothetical protein